MNNGDGEREQKREEKRAHLRGVWAKLWSTGPGGFIPRKNMKKVVLVGSL
jgi:hypothetical protein